MQEEAHPKSTGRTGAKTRERILVEASRLLATHGYNGTTTREIAKAVGISQPSLFFHFATKQEIAETLYRLDIEPAVDRLERLLDGEGVPAAKLHALLVGELTYIFSSEHDLRVHMSYEVLNDPDLAEYRTLINRFDDMVRTLIRMAQADGTFAADDPWLAQQMVSGLLARATMFGEAAERPSFPEECATLMLRGMLIDRDALPRIRDEADHLVREYWPAGE